MGQANLEGSTTMAKDGSVLRRRGLVSLFLSCLRKPKRSFRNNRLMTTPDQTTASTTSDDTTPSKQQQVQSSSCEPNWDDLVLSTPVDLDDLDSDCDSSLPETPHVLNTIQDDESSTSWWLQEPTSSRPLLGGGDGSVNVQDKLHTTTADGLKKSKDASSLQVPLSRRILVDLAQVVDSLQAPAQSPAGKDSVPRTRGNASLGDSQPRQPTRQSHQENTTNDKNTASRGGLPPKMTTVESPEQGGDDLSSCSGITIDSTLYFHSERILSSLFTQPQLRT